MVFVFHYPIDKSVENVMNVSATACSHCGSSKSEIDLHDRIDQVSR